MSTSGAPARYFIMRSISEANLYISVEESAWATQKHNEARLNEAFAEGPVRLLYSVNSSGSFQGYASMTGKVGELGRRLVWENGQTFGVSLSVDWNCLFELPFGEVEHLRNSMNENKPVKIARDGQEVPSTVGDELIALMDAKAKASGAKPPKVQVQLMKMAGQHQHNNNGGGGGGRHERDRERGGGDRQQGHFGGGGRQHMGNGGGMDGGRGRGGMMGHRGGMDMPFMDHGGGMGGGMGGMGGMNPLGMAMAMGAADPMMAGMMAGMMQGPMGMGMGMGGFPPMGGFPMSMPGMGGQMGGMGALGMGAMGAMSGMGQTDAMLAMMGGNGANPLMLDAMMGQQRPGMLQTPAMALPGLQQQRGLGGMLPPAGGLASMLGLPSFQQQQQLQQQQQPAPPPQRMQLPGLPNGLGMQQMNGMLLGGMQQQQLPSLSEQQLLQQQRMMQASGMVPGDSMGAMRLPAEMRLPSERSSRRSRSRSRSPSRRRGRSRERAGRSRERSRTRSRSPRRDSILDMSYDEYLDHYRKSMHRSKEVSTSAARRADSPARRDGGYTNGGGSGAGGGMMMQQGSGGGLGMGMGMSGNGAQANGASAHHMNPPSSSTQATSQPATYTEEQYIQLTTDMYLSKGAKPPSTDFIRDYYRRMLAQSQ